MGTLNLTEFNKLKQCLRNNKVPFTVESFVDGYCLKISDNLDCVIYTGSYGYEYGLLEIMGGLTVAENNVDSVRGYLTGIEVCQRFKYCYRNDVNIYHPDDGGERKIQKCRLRNKKSKSMVKKY